MSEAFSFDLRARLVADVKGIIDVADLDQTQSYRMGTGGALTGAAGDPGFPNRMCGLKVHHINGIWECFYSAGVDDGIVDPALASDTGLVLGGEACIWGEGTSAFSLDTQAFTLAAAAAERFWHGAAVADATTSAPSDVFANCTPPGRSTLEAAEFTECSGSPPTQPACAYNAMIAPLTRVAIKAVAWYQGEGGCRHYDGCYPCVFTQMIRSWEHKWAASNSGASPTLPFGFVQLAPS